MASSSMQLSNKWSPLLLCNFFKLCYCINDNLANSYLWLKARLSSSPFYQMFVLIVDRYSFDGFIA